MTDYLVYKLILVAVIFGITLLIAMYSTYFERKVATSFTAVSFASEPEHCSSTFDIGTGASDSSFSERSIAGLCDAWAKI